MSCEYRPRILHEFMQTFFGKPAILLGKVASIEPTGKKVCVRDCSGQNVMVWLKEPLTGMLELESWVEIEGKVKGKGNMEGDRLDQLPASLFENFDNELYVTMTKMLINPGTSNNYVVEDKAEHHGVGPDIELISSAGDSNKTDLEGMGGEESFLNL